jgi:Gpi18-like mannosyltransferase
MKSIKNWFKGNKGVFKFILVAFVIWQLALIAFIALGNKVIPTSNQYVYTEKRVVNPPWLWSRANFDGTHYLDIARKGYGIYQQAFFPLYPNLIKFLTPFFNGQSLLAGWTINLVSFLLSLWFFYQLVKMDFKDKIAKRSLFYLLIFPTAFFFSMIYTESLFFFFILASFYFAKTKKWWWAGIFGCLASATRLVGVFLLPALIVEWWMQNKSFNDKGKKNKQSLNIMSALPLLLIPLGLLWYMRYLAINYNDALLFFHVQANFGAGRSSGSIILLYQVFWRYFKMLVTVQKNSLTYFIVVLEFLSGFSFLGLIIFTFIRRWYSYGVFMVLAYLAPTLTGTFISLPRYVLVLFPVFILLALWSEKYRWVKIIYPLVSIPLLIICLWLFTRGYWLA